MCAGLAQLLPSTDVQQIYMQGNEVGDNGAIALAQAVQQMPRMRHLNLRGNKNLGRTGREALENTLKSGIVVL